MESPENKQSPEQASEIYHEKDVLGLDKPTVTSAANAKPGRLFIGLILVIIGIALVCWLLARHT